MPGMPGGGRSVILALIVASLWQPLIEDERADIVEVNRTIHDDGAELAQVIWWRLDGPRLEVLDWRMLDDCGEPFRVRGGWRCEWREGGRIVRVTAPVLRRTITPTDPEVDERSHRPECERPRVGMKRR